jgi:Cu+-exporting ATPase
MVALAKYAKKIVRWSFLFSLMYNVTGVGFAVLGLLTPVIAAILMPLSSISVVLLVTVLVRLKSQKLNLI